MTTKAASPTFIRSDLVIIGGGVAAVVLAGVTHYAGGGAVLAFVFAGVAVTLLAALVGRSVDQLGDRFGPGATGVLQSALGNLPELFIALFALQAGLLEVVQAALIGSILANLLLVMGLCFLVGGLKHGTQQLNSERARGIIVLMVLSVAALVLPSLAFYVHAPAAGHETTLSLIVAVILLVLFGLTLPASLRKSPTPDVAAEQEEPPRWPRTAAPTTSWTWPIRSASNSSLRSFVAILRCASAGSYSLRSARPEAPPAVRRPSRTHRVRRSYSTSSSRPCTIRA